MKPDSAGASLPAPASRIAALAYQPPPGPPDPPKPQTCPHGHALVWISPQVALCDGQDWELLWELVPARACHGASVRAVVLPAARIERLEAALRELGAEVLAELGDEHPAMVQAQAALAEEG